MLGLLLHKDGDNRFTEIQHLFRLDAKEASLVFPALVKEVTLRHLRIALLRHRLNHRKVLAVGALI